MVRLKRSIEVFKDKGKDVLFIKEDFTYTEEFDAECPKLDIEEKEFIIYVPEKLQPTDLHYKVSLEEKPLAHGLSPNVWGELFSIGYEV